MSLLKQETGEARLQKRGHYLFIDWFVETGSWRTRTLQQERLVIDGFIGVLVCLLKQEVREPGLCSKKGWLLMDLLVYWFVCWNRKFENPDSAARKAGYWWIYWCVCLFVETGNWRSWALQQERLVIDGFIDLFILLRQEAGEPGLCGKKGHFIYIYNTYIQCNNSSTM